MKTNPIVKVTDGILKVGDQIFRYEFLSDKKDHYINIFHPGVQNGQTQFKRNEMLRLKDDMENALFKVGISQ